MGSRALAAINRFPIGIREVRIGEDRLYPFTLDRYLTALTWKFGLLGRTVRKFIANEVKPGMVAVDVGANIGFQTIGLARLVGPKGKVHAIEPEPRNFQALARTVDCSKFANVHLHSVAAWESEGVISLHLSGFHGGDHRTSRRFAPDKITPLFDGLPRTYKMVGWLFFPPDERRDSIKVAARSLDALLADEPRIDFVKMDVQGAEISVLLGAREMLRRNPQIRILCEFVPEFIRRAGGDPRQLFDCIAETGLSIHWLNSRGKLIPIEPEPALALAERAGSINLYLRGL